MDAELKKDPDRLKDLVELVRQLQHNVFESREELSRMAQERKQQEEKRSAATGKEDGAKIVNDHLNDTILSLQMEASELTNQIEDLNRKLKNCSLRQAALRQDLQDLNERGIPWSRDEDRIELAIIDAEKGSVERKQLEEKLAEVKGFQRACKNSRMALVEHRVYIDKEKQRLFRTLDSKQLALRKANSRLAMVTDLGKAILKAADNSDALLSFLREQWQSVRDYFIGKTNKVSFVQVMQEMEVDNQFLDEVESKMRLVLDNTPGRTSDDRSTLALSILHDLLDAHRSNHSLLLHRWDKDDLDMSFFVRGSQKPVPFAGRGELDRTASSLPKPALMDAPLQLEDGKA